MKFSREPAGAYAQRVYAAAMPDPTKDEDVRVLDALTALAQVLTIFGQAAGADLDDLLDLVEDAYAEVKLVQNPVVTGPVGEA